MTDSSSVKFHSGESLTPAATPGEGSAITASLEVFDPEYRFIVTVPVALITHLPSSSKHITRLMLCRNYRPGPDGDPLHLTCPSTNHCRYVHVNIPSLDALPKRTIHVNYIWTHESKCTYPAMDPGAVVTVQGMSTPNGASSREEATCVICIPSERLLRTKGTMMESQRRLSGCNEGNVLAACSEYHFRQMCRMGDECSFAHVIVVDPLETKAFKRAHLTNFKDVLDPTPRSNTSSRPQEESASLNVSRNVSALQRDLVLPSPIPPANMVYPSTSSFSQPSYSMMASPLQFVNVPSQQYFPVPQSTASFGTTQYVHSRHPSMIGHHAQHQHHHQVVMTSLPHHALFAPVVHSNMTAPSPLVGAAAPTITSFVPQAAPFRTMAPTYQQQQPHHVFLTASGHPHSYQGGAPMTVQPHLAHQSVGGQLLYFQ